MLDTGKIGDTQHCPPHLLVFDLETDTLLRQHKFPTTLYRGTSLFITPVVDVRDPGVCDNTKVYVGDVNGFAIIVYDYQSDVSWRAQNKLTYPHPKYGTFTIAGESFDLMDGILGMALSPRSGGRLSQKVPLMKVLLNFLGAADFPCLDYFSDRLLYFHALASITENAVSLRTLDNSTAWQANVDSLPRSFYEIGSRGTQSAAQAMDRNGNLFFGLMDPIGIACWDSKRSYSRDNMRIVSQNDVTLQFASGMKVITNTKGREELWVATCRFQVIEPFVSVKWLC